MIRDWICIPYGIKFVFNKIYVSKNYQLEGTSSVNSFLVHHDISSNCWHQMVIWVKDPYDWRLLKGALDKYNIIPPIFFQKKVGTFIPLEVGMSNDCMLSLTF